MTTLLILASLLQCPDQPMKAKVAWSWAVAKQGQKQPKQWPCDVCNGTGRGGLCTNCDGTGKVNYDPAKDGPGKPAVKKVVALLIVEIPLGAQIWIQGQQQYGTGETVRTFESPPLEVGRTFYYTVKVRDVMGKEESVTVEVQAGRTSRVSFMRLRAVEFQNMWPGVGRMQSGC